MNACYLIDTNILIEFFSGNKETVFQIRSLKKQGSLFVSLLSIAEIRMGWSHSKAEIYIPLLYELFEVQSLSKDIAEQAGVWRRLYREKGITLSVVDTLIAATAYCQDLQLVTRNKKHFPMQELTIIS